MDTVEIRNLDEAKRYVVEGLWLQRVMKPSAVNVRSILEWAMEVVSGNNSLPPIGFVADVGHIIFGNDIEHKSKESVNIPNCSTMLRTYEDHILGKVYADWMVDRASDAVRKLKGKDRTKGLSYVIAQIMERTGIRGVILSPAIIRELLPLNHEELLTNSWSSITQDGLHPLLVKQYQEIASIGRIATDLLVKEDVEALEDKSALGDMSQYVALRQIRQTTARIESGLPVRPVLPWVGRKEVPTRILDEDQYPIGGYTSISSKGSIESLLHSQLAYMEKESPDLFDMKFVRDELFYYSRDENQFLRHRRAFVFALFPDLITARFKDLELPHQRIVMIQSSILGLIHKFSDWLSSDAIRFEIVFVQKEEKTPLSQEMTLSTLLIRELIERGDGIVATVPDQEGLVAYLNNLSRSNQVHCLVTSTNEVDIDMNNVGITKMVVDSSIPQIEDMEIFEEEEVFETWQQTVLRILQLWI